jgi:hypothetical protein
MASASDGGAPFPWITGAHAPPNPSPSRSSSTALVRCPSRSLTAGFGRVDRPPGSISDPCTSIRILMTRALAVGEGWSEAKGDLASSSRSGGAAAAPSSPFCRCQGRPLPSVSIPRRQAMGQLLPTSPAPPYRGCLNSRPRLCLTSAPVPHLPSWDATEGDKVGGG